MIDFNEATDRFVEIWKSGAISIEMLRVTGIPIGINLKDPRIVDILKEIE